VSKPKRIALISPSEPLTSYYLNRVFGENFRDKCYVRDVLCRNIVITEKEEYIIIHSKNIKPDGILEKVLSSLNIEP
jgi:hypothetical protein